MCWVDWIHDTQIWIETPFCKYHQEETKMCNGCSTVTCQCKPQRLPKVGEVWTYNDKSVNVLAVTEEAVLYKNKTGGMFGATSLKGFCDYFRAPKPKPRELYIQTPCSVFFGDNGVVSPFYTKEYADRYPNSKFVKFVEVLD